MVSGLGAAGMSTVRIFNVTIGGGIGHYRSKVVIETTSRRSIAQDLRNHLLLLVPFLIYGIDANRGWTFAQAENLGLTFTTGKQC